MAVGTFAGCTVSFGIRVYNEGRGVLATLDSLYEGMRLCALEGTQLVVFDSSEDEEAVEAVRAWAPGKVALSLERSPTRATSKQAANAIHDLANGDFLVQVDADLVVPPESLRAMLLTLVGEPFPEVVSGGKLPDPAYWQRRYRASAYQLRATYRFACLLPPERPRAETAFWGTRRSFYSSYRFPLRTGLSDGGDLLTHLLAKRVPYRFCAGAVALAVPAGSSHDFHLQTRRYFRSAQPVQGRSLTEARAAALEALRDPVGAAFYAGERVRSALRRQALDVERWEIATSTKRS